MSFSERVEWESLELMDLRGYLSFLGAMFLWILQVPWIEWLGMKLSPLINLIWKLGFKIIQSIKLYLKAIYLIVFLDVKKTFKIPWFKTSVWNFEMHKGMLKISFIKRLWMNWVPKT